MEWGGEGGWEFVLPTSSVLVLSLQAQAGTYPGRMVCPEAGTLHPLVLQDVPMKGISALSCVSLILSGSHHASHG